MHRISDHATQPLRHHLIPLRLTRACSTTATAISTPAAAAAAAAVRDGTLRMPEVPVSVIDHATSETTANVRLSCAMRLEKHIAMTGWFDRATKCHFAGGMVLKSEGLGSTMGWTRSTVLECAHVTRRWLVRIRLDRIGWVDVRDIVEAPVKWLEEFFNRAWGRLRPTLSEWVVMGSFRRHSYVPRALAGGNLNIQWARRRRGFHTRYRENQGNETRNVQMQPPLQG